MHLIFKFELESEPGAKRKLKVEINTREHASFLPVRLYPFAVKSR